MRVVTVVRRLLGAESEERLRAIVRHHRARPRVGAVRLGALRSLEPISRNFGAERGTPIDRYYIERFLERYTGVPGYIDGDIRGRVLEFSTSMYAKKFGRSGEPGSGVTSVDVMHIDASSPEATVVGDLEAGTGLESGAFDCILCTQVLHLVYDVAAAVRHLERALAPGGVLLATLPAVSPSCQPDRDLAGDFWRFTVPGVRRLFGEVFPAAELDVSSYGNVLSVIGRTAGLAVEDLSAAELNPHDPDYELIVTVRARKPAS